MLRPTGHSAPLVVLATVATLAALALGGCSDNVVGEETGAPVGTPSGPPPSPADTDAGVEDAESFPATPDPEAGLSAVIADSGLVAEAMKAYYEGDTPAADLDGFLADVQAAGVALSIGNTIDGYAPDADPSDFRVCVDNDEGDYAIYDTATKQVEDSGDDGGCTLADDGASLR